MRSRIAAIAFAITGLTLAGAGAAYAFDDGQVSAGGCHTEALSEQVRRKFCGWRLRGQR